MVGGRLTTSEPCVDIVVKSAHIFAKQNDMKVLKIGNRTFTSDIVQGKICLCINNGLRLTKYTTQC